MIRLLLISSCLLFILGKTQAIDIKLKISLAVGPVNNHNRIDKETFAVIICRGCNEKTNNINLKLFNPQNSEVKAKWFEVRDGVDASIKRKSTQIFWLKSDQAFAYGEYKLSGAINSQKINIKITTQQSKSTLSKLGILGIRSDCRLTAEWSQVFQTKLYILQLDKGKSNFYTKENQVELAPNDQKCRQYLYEIDAFYVDLYAFDQNFLELEPEQLKPNINVEMGEFEFGPPPPN